MRPSWRGALRGLDLLHDRPAEETLGPDEKHDEEECERYRLAIGDVVGGDERLREPDDQTAQHGAGNVAQATEHDHRETLETERDAEVWSGDADAEPDEGARHASEEAAHKEREDDEPTRVDAEQARGDRILRHRAQGLARPGHVHEQREE